MLTEVSVRDRTAEELNCLFRESFNMVFEMGDEIKRSRNLLCGDMGLKPRDLLMLYYVIKKRFNIEIPEEDIVNGSFSSFNGILDIICRCREC